MKQWVEFKLIFFGAAKKDCVIKTREMFSFPSSIGTVKVMYFSVFSPKQVNCFLNFSANSFMIK